jgi:hypothetical protein
MAHQPSCLWPATLAAGLKGSWTMAEAANVLKPEVKFRELLSSERGRILVAARAN